MLLLWGALFWTGCLLNIYSELRFRLVFVYWPSWIMYLIIHVDATPLSISRKPVQGPIS